MQVCSFKLGKAPQLKSMWFGCHFLLFFLLRILIWDMYRSVVSVDRYHRNSIFAPSRRIILC
jgi:hypothetical protein